MLFFYEIFFFLTLQTKHWISVKMVHWSKTVTNFGFHDNNNNNNILFERMEQLTEPKVKCQASEKAHRLALGIWEIGSDEQYLQVLSDVPWVNLPNVKFLQGSI